MNILFICSRNKWRSRTAETIFKNSQVHQVKSAGTANSATVRINQQILLWADIIFVMEDKHKKHLKEQFNSITINDKIIVLGIPDDYQYMDPELIDLIKTSVSPYLV